MKRIKKVILVLSILMAKVAGRIVGTVQGRYWVIQRELRHGQ